MPIIIGSGISGSFAAEQLAKHHEVHLFERKKDLHKTCSGILTYKIHDLVDLPRKLVQCKIYDVKVHSPNNSIFSLRFKKPDVVLHRKEFNEWLQDRAVAKGAVLHEEHLFEKLDGKKVQIKNLKTGMTKEWEDELVVGADGALSRVAKQAGMYGERTFFTAIKAEVRAKHDGAIHFYPHYKDFAWTNPINEHEIEIGIAAQKNPVETFNAFYKKIEQEMNITLLRKESALIPLYNPKQVMQKNNVYLIGDAGTINKPTSGGGIIFGLRSANILAESVEKKKKYNVQVKKEIGKELWMHTKMRRVMNKFTHDDWNKFIEYAKDPKIASLLESHSRDYPIVLGAKALLKQPKFLYFAKYIGAMMRD